MKSHLIKYANGLVGQYHQTEGNNKLAIYLWWAPSLPSAMDKESWFLVNSGFDLVRPDYYGYARSDWFFSPKNCIQTIYNTIQIFNDRLPVFSIYLAQEIIPSQYNEIILIGASYGWWIASIMPKFDIKIKEIVLMYPALDRLDRNEHVHKESTDEDFLREYSLWYKHLYRFTEWTDPYEAMLDIGEFDSKKDCSHLSDTKVFVWHGSADDVIWCGRSKQFVEQLTEMNSNGKYYYAEYYGLWHGGTCKEAALKWRLHRRKQF
jgi:hypothetical protein